MAHILNELSNDIYDHNSITEGDVNLIKSHGICPYTVFLGVFVSLIPKVIPRILPTFTKDKAIKERYDDESYQKEVEVMFRQRFAANLETFEKLIRAWKDNTLEFEDLGLNIDPDSALAKEDLVAGEPESFQTDLLKGIKFLQYRVSRMSKPDDRIEQIADVIWTLANTVYDTVYSYFRPISQRYMEENNLEKIDYYSNTK